MARYKFYKFYTILYCIVLSTAQGVEQNRPGELSSIMTRYFVDECLHAVSELVEVTDLCRWSARHLCQYLVKLL